MQGKKLSFGIPSLSFFETEPLITMFPFLRSSLKCTLNFSYLYSLSVFFKVWLTLE